MLSNRKLSIVVADDDAKVREWFERIVAGLGHHAVFAQDGKSCIQKIAMTAPDILFVDLFMPVVDGIHVIRHVQENHPRVRVFAMSAMDDTVLIDEILRNGATAFLIKPLNEGSVTEIIMRAASGTLPGDNQRPRAE